ncbi:MAG: TadE/TadG family type IV pilus assembly protein [Rhodomicrobium sp.]
MHLFFSHRLMRPEKWLGRLAAATRLFGRRDDGAILFEAAIVIPILLMMFLGMVEFSEAFTARRRVATVATTTADLVSQATSVSTADLNDIVSVANSLLAPYSVSTLNVTISSVGYDANSNVVSYWNCTWSNVSAAPTCASPGTAPTLPTGLISAGQSIIVAQASYTFTPPIGQFLLGGVPFNSIAYYKPRFTLTVAMQ